MCLSCVPGEIFFPAPSPSKACKDGKAGEQIRAMILQKDATGSQTLALLAQIHNACRRRYRILGLATTITLLVVIIPHLWFFSTVDPNCADSCSRFGFYYNSIFPGPKPLEAAAAADAGSTASVGYYESLIPAKIWQIYLPMMRRHGDHWHEQSFIHPDALKETPTWIALNPDHDL